MEFMVSEGLTEWCWLIGIILTLLGATLTVVGLMVQKRSHHVKDMPLFDKPVPYWMQGPWVLGGVIWISGNMLCWVALGLAPQSILASMNCLNIIITIIIAPWFLGEKVSHQTLRAAGLLLVGTAWVIASGPKDYQVRTLPSIVQALTKLQSICAFGLTIGFLIGMTVLACVRWERKLAPTLTYAQFTIVSAIFAWYSTLLSKSTAKVIAASVQLWSPMYKNWVFWAFSAGFVLAAVAQGHLLNMALKYGNAVHVIPLYEALSMTGQIVVGGLVFDEFASLGVLGHLSFWPGVGIVLLGMSLLAFEARDSMAELNDENTPLKVHRPLGNAWSQRAIPLGGL